MPPPDGSSTGALWTVGLGAFLLVAAAATFVAVNWDEIDDRIKLGALIVFTDACLLAHRRLREPLPITATALFHLGVLLVPIDVAAVGAWFGWTWSEMLLAQGLAATATFGIAAWTERSAVLRLAAWTGVVTLAAGIGGTSGAPAGLVLAGVALLATVAHGYLDHPRGGPADDRHGRHGGDDRSLGLEWGAAGWAALAGLAVPLAGAEQLGWPAAGVLTDLGLASEAPHPTAAATGLVAGLALAITAHRRRSLPAAALALGCALTGLVTTWVGLEPSGPASLAATAALLLVVQVAAWVGRDDAFWRRPTLLLAQAGEVLTVLLTLGLAGALVVAPSGPAHDPTIGLAAALVALTWLVAEAHVQSFAVGQPGAFWLDSTPLPVSAAVGPFGAAVAACASVALLSGSSLATAAALTGFGGVAVLLGPVLSAAWPASALASDVRPVTASQARRWQGHTTKTVTSTVEEEDAASGETWPAWQARHVAGQGARDAHQILTAHLLAWAPFVAGRSRPLVAVLALAGALAVAEAAVRTSRAGRTGVPAWFGATGPAVTRPAAVVLTVLALMPIASGAAVLAVDGLGIAAATGAIAAAWLVAAVLDRADQPAGTVPLATVPRLAGLVPLAFLPLLPDHAEAAIAGLVAALAVVDALRRDEPLLLAGAGAAMPFAVLGLAGNAGWTTADTGVIVTLTGVAWLGLGACLPSRWAPPMLLSAVGAAGAGLHLSLDHPPAVATNLLLVGGTLAAAGLALRRSEPATIGLGVATIGLWGHLQLAGVTAAEPYVAPVALLVLVAGIHARRAHEASSWLAHAPAVVLLGGSALLERLGGGGGWHALFAGAVGTVAVAAGATRRLAGPLLVGTLLVLATVVHETLGVTTTLGTPVWLAIGGLVLLAAGVAMERRGVGPVEAGRRLIDVVNERFA